MYRPPLQKTGPKKLGIFIRRTLIVRGAFLCAVGLFGPVFSVGGTASLAWALAVGAMLVLVGLAKGIAWCASGPFEKAGPSMWTVSADEDTPRSHAHGFGGRTGPLVNVDGTPMLNDFIDVAGRAYGDSGTMFSHDSGAGMWDGGFPGGLDSHHVGGSDW